MKHKRYSQEFKDAVVQRIMDGEPQTSVANSLGISSKTIGHWYIKAKNQLDDHDLQQHDEVIRLKEELRKVKAENEFLKKAAAYFAKLH